MSPVPAADYGVHLAQVDQRGEEVAALAERCGGRVGLPGVLADLDRSARVGAVPARAAAWGFRLDAHDDQTRRWWPQGITTSADASPLGHVGGRSVVITSAYSRELRGVDMGARVTVTDVSDPTRVRYRHVLLVEAVMHGDRLTLRPVNVHAGGLVWLGRHLHVAGTASGMRCFRLDDIIAVPGGGAHGRLELGEGPIPDVFGYRYVLPQRFRYAAHHEPAVEPIRYSFISLDRTTSPYRLMAGEYGRNGASTRIVRYQVDPRWSLPEADWAGVARPLGIEIGLPGMQGVVVVQGRHYISTSAGSRRRGTLWVGNPGSLTARRGVLSIGPEDLAYWPATDQIWTVSEYPGRRYVYAMNRGDLD